MGEAIVRHSLRPPALRGRDVAAEPGQVCRGDAIVCLQRMREVSLEHETAATSVIASAAKQSRVVCGTLDCFAALAMTEERRCVRLNSFFAGCISLCRDSVARSLGASANLRCRPGQATTARSGGGALTRDPYSVTAVGLRKPGHLVVRHRPVVMDPCVRRDDSGVWEAARVCPDDVGRRPGVWHVLRPIGHTGLANRPHGGPSPGRCIVTVRAGD
jgi:hypothetical protein